MTPTMTEAAIIGANNLIVNNNNKTHCFCLLKVCLNTFKGASEMKNDVFSKYEENMKKGECTRK